MLKRLFWAVCGLWALVVLSLTHWGEISPESARAVAVFAAAPLVAGLLLAKVLGYVVTGSLRSRP